MRREGKHDCAQVVPQLFSLQSANHWSRQLLPMLLERVSTHGLLPGRWICSPSSLVNRPRFISDAFEPVMTPVKHCNVIKGFPWLSHHKRLLRNSNVSKFSANCQPVFS